ncbi:MAG: zinc ribbon domain-containing protein [Chloroflexi bacterium]|nr:zinc ribbon domain-containing protein [Chloroflexota bacterium]
MPVYEYVCTGCSLKFELLKPMSQADNGATCPNCQKPGKRQMSTFASFSKSAGGASQPIAGGGSGCATCGSSSCSTCG